MTPTDHLRRRLLTTLAATASLAALSTLALPAMAQTYPDKTVTFIVPFPAGSATDQLARALAQSITQDTKQPVVVDNRGGAGGLIAAGAAAKAAPDGYTVLITTNTTHAAAEHLFKKLPYDPVKDFAPITALSTGSQVMVVNAASPARCSSNSPTPTSCTCPTRATRTRSPTSWAGRSTS